MRGIGISRQSLVFSRGEFRHRANEERAPPVVLVTSVPHPSFRRGGIFFLGIKNH